ncbi:MAG: hypothetical protein FWE57_06055 [Chitinispirillia bacterium]|nr:hypothetical protein [Chitinispirillia bacterium]
MQTRFLSHNKRFITRVFITGALLAAAFSCDSLFLPTTGLPEDAKFSRATPRGTIELLLRAYQERRIDLFTELLPKNKSFRFFMSPEYSLDEYGASGANATMLSVNDSQYHYVKARNYYFWGHDSEVAKHRKLFDLAEIIEFREPPIIDDERDFRYTVNENNDTTHVELRMRYGELCVGLNREDWCTQNRQMQVFLLEKETDRTSGERLWVIRDWFDLDYIF